jgi:ElaB/YqjD/DUF883 family membrane-anchored ribosome-binding protein
MKQAEVKPTGDAGTIPAGATGPEPNARRDLQWVDEVAALLPEDARLGWYQNVRPWLRMLPPDDEIAHLAYSMGYLALLTRSTPAVMATERSKMGVMLNRLNDEMTGALKTTADYHEKLNNRLTALPAEIAQGVNPAALAARLVAEVREQFLKCGIPEAGRLLREQGESFKQLAAAHAHTLMEVQEKLYACQHRVTSVLDAVAGTADSAKTSINKWDREMRKVQWVQIGSAWSIGLFLGALMCWWVVAPQGNHPRQELMDTTAQHTVAASGKTSLRMTNAGRPERARISGTASERKPKR